MGEVINFSDSNPDKSRKDSPQSPEGRVLMEMIEIPGTAIVADLEIAKALMKAGKSKQG